MTNKAGQLKLFLLFVHLFISVQLTGQNIKLIHYRTEDKVLLRWAPTNAADLNRLKNYGFNMERFTVARDSVRIFPAEKKVVKYGIKTADLQSWEQGYLSDKYAAIAAQALYGDTFLINLQDDFTGPIQAIQQAEELEARYSFLMLACEQSFEVARMAGLGIEDSNITSNESYLYKLYWQGGDLKSDTVFVFVPQIETAPLPSLRNLKAEFGENIVELSWDNLAYDNTYTSYEVEISTDGSAFEVIDSVASIQTNTNKSTGIFSRQLTLPDTSKMFYRIRGINSFGMRGPPSNIVSGTAKEIPRVELYLIERTAKENEVTLELRVNSDSRKEDLKILKTTLLKSLDSKAYLEVVSEEGVISLLNDLQPTPSAYYKARLEVQGGKTFESFPILVQVPDSIPPDIPGGLHGTCDSLGIVRLSWNSVCDKGLGGYRVYRSRVENGEFRQLSTRAITDTVFYDSIGVHKPETIIYYKVQAEDLRLNRSKLSPSIGVLTIDHIPPPPPRIIGYEVIDSVVSIHWVSSASNNNLEYYIFRRTSLALDSIKLNVKTEDQIYQTQKFLDFVNYSGQVNYFLKLFDRQTNLFQTSDTIDLNINLRKFDDFKLESEVDRRNHFIKLSWEKECQDCFVKLFRRTDNSLMRLISEFANDNNYVDKNLAFGQVVTYLIVIQDRTRKQHKLITIDF